MKHNNTFFNLLITFFITTACITILEGILGLLFIPDLQFGYEAFFVPPIFGFLSTMTGLVLKSKKELTVKQVLFREFIQLLLIESIVFGSNYIAGNIYEVRMNVALALSIAIVFILIHLILWLNDRRIAVSFNEHLKAFQENHEA